MEMTSSSTWPMDREQIQEKVATDMIVFAIFLSGVVVGVGMTSSWRTTIGAGIICVVGFLVSFVIEAIIQFPGNPTEG